MLDTMVDRLVAEVTLAVTIGGGLYGCEWRGGYDMRERERRAGERSVAHDESGEANGELGEGPK